jgi:iron complex transport system substrate-binding protein
MPSPARIWFGVLIVVAGLAVASTPAIPEDGHPQRIVSANLCADRLVLQLADRRNVVSVSYFAADPAFSTVVDAAAGIRINHGSVEDIVSLHPDLVVLGSSTSLSTGAMLRSLGIRVYELPSANSIEATRSIIRALARTIGTPERGEQLIAGMERRLAALPRPAHRLKAADYQAGGWSAGRHTMADDLFRRLNLGNVAAEAGIDGFGALPLETLVASSPDLIVFEDTGSEAPSIAGDLLHHPALVHGHARIVRMPMRLWACPDPAVADAAALIAGAAR